MDVTEVNLAPFIEDSNFVEYLKMLVDTKTV